MSREDLNLEDIPGLGRVRREALAEAGIHDLAGLLRLKVAELAAIRGVGAWQARRIAEFLRQRGLALEVETAGGSPAVVVTMPQSAEDVALVEEAVETLSAQAALEAELEFQVEHLEAAAAAEREFDETDALNDEETALIDAVNEPMPAAEDPEESPAASRRGTRKGKASKSRVRTAKEKKQRASEWPVGSEEPAGSATATETAGEAAAPNPLPAATAWNAREAVPESAAPYHAAEPPDQVSTNKEEGAANQVQEQNAAEEEGAVHWESRIREQREQLPEAALELMEAIRAAAVSKQLTRQITRLLITAGEFITGSHPTTPDHRQAASEALAQAERALRRAVERRSFSEKQQRELANRIRRRRKELEQLLEPQREPTREQE